jgi:hypothetical protein
MTPLEDVFMLEKSLRLNFQTMLAIYKSGAAALARGFDRNCGTSQQA